jgi:hypothetical protein
MAVDKGDHVQWLRMEGIRLRTGAASVEDEGKRRKVEERAWRFFAAADALQLALAGVNAEMTGGFRAAAYMLRPGARVGLALVNGAAVTGVMGAIGKYDFVFLGDDGRELVVAKHGVVYWELVGEVEDGG